MVIKRSSANSQLLRSMYAGLKSSLVTDDIGKKVWNHEMANFSRLDGVMFVKTVLRDLDHMLGSGHSHSHANRANFPS